MDPSHKHLCRMTGFLLAAIPYSLYVGQSRNSRFITNFSQSIRAENNYINILTPPRFDPQTYQMLSRCLDHQTMTTPIIIQSYSSSFFIQHQIGMILVYDLLEMLSNVQFNFSFSQIALFFCCDVKIQHCKLSSHIIFH